MRNDHSFTSLIHSIRFLEPGLRRGFNRALQGRPEGFMPSFLEKETSGLRGKFGRFPHTWVWGVIEAASSPQFRAGMLEGE